MRLPLWGLGMITTATLLWGVAWSEEKPDAARTLKEVVRAMNKARSYQVELKVEGGFAQGKDHQITEHRVNRSYQAECYGPLMQLPEPRIIRSTEKGAIHSGERWMQLLALPDGAMVERLFHFPQLVLADTILQGGSVTWSEGAKKQVIDGEGLTGVAREVSVDGDRLLVEVPTKVAVQRYTRIQNSGCTAAG